MEVLLHVFGDWTFREISKTASSIWEISVMIHSRTFLKVITQNTGSTIAENVRFKGIESIIESETSKQYQTYNMHYACYG